MSLTQRQGDPLLASLEGPRAPGGHTEGVSERGGSPKRGRVVGIVVAVVVVAILALVGVTAGGDRHPATVSTGHRPGTAPEKTPVDVGQTDGSAPPTTTPTSTATPTSARPQTTVPSPPKVTTPPATQPSALPSVTAGTAVPWSPTSSKVLVGDGGNPKDWPAAQPNPPSLSGAYGDNMIRAVVTLIRYQDWVWSHPNPALVSRYMLAGTSLYSGEVTDVRNLETKGWHADPIPTQIDWAGVTEIPKPLLGRNGKPVVVRGHERYGPGMVNIVVTLIVEPYLNASGEVASHSPGGGKAALSETMEQGSDGQWRLSNTTRLAPVGGFGSLAK